MTQLPYRKSDQGRRAARLQPIGVAGAFCPPKPHPLAPSPLRGEGEPAFGILPSSTAPSYAGPPSPRSGEGPRVRLRRAGRPRGHGPGLLIPFHLFSAWCTLVPVFVCPTNSLKVDRRSLVSCRRH